MFTKRFFAAILATLLSATFFVACDSTPEVIEDIDVTGGVYVLNAGKYKSNNASLTYFDFRTQFATGDIFLDKNNRGLGDGGQDMIVYGSKMYVSMYGSALIEVIDPKTAKTIKSVPLKGEGETVHQPRTLTAANGKVYIVLYDGYVAQMDTTTFAIQKKVKVGLSPDGSVIANNKLYVANTGGMYRPQRDKTVSVIDLAKFEEIKKIEVNLNPQDLAADSRGNVYVRSNGDYTDANPGKFQRIKTNDAVEDIDIKGAQGFDVYQDKAYIYTFDYDENWQATNTKIVVYDVINNKVISENIAKSPIEKTPYSIGVDPKTADIYVGVTDYVNNGKMYRFGNNGELKSTFTAGVNPCKAVFFQIK